MKFKAKKDRSTGVIFLIAALICFMIIVMLIAKGNIQSMDVFGSLLLVAIIGLFAWIWFDTSYELKRKKLYYQSGPIRGSIEISEMVKITEVNFIFAGLKPALARGGIIITYHKWDEIYIAPLHKDELICELLKINPNVTIILLN